MKNNRKIIHRLILLLTLFLTLPIHADSILANLSYWIAGTATDNQTSGANFKGGATADGGKSFDTMFDADQKINFLAYIRVATHHIGKTGSIYVAARYNNLWFMQNGNGRQAWNAQIADLVSFTGPRPLEQLEALKVAEQLSGLVGNFEVYVGYKVDGVIHYNAQPFSFTVKESVKLPPAPENLAPVADAGDSRDVKELAQVTLDGSKSHDPDGTIVKYLWEQTGGTTAKLINPTGAKLTFTAPEVNRATDLQFKLTVTDNQGATASATVDVTVRDVPVAVISIPSILECISPQIMQNGICVDPPLTCTLPQLLQNGICVDPPITCTAPQIVQNGVCVDPPITCTLPQILQNGICVDPPIICTEPQVVQNGICVDPQPQTSVKIIEPANFSFFNIGTITVSGTVEGGAENLTVNGILATLNAPNWSASIPLQEGNNTLTAVATKTGGAIDTASIQVTLDTTPPRVTVAAPADGFKTTEDKVTVTGIVNDIVVGTVNSGQAQVTVNGVKAQVANRTYTAVDIPLQTGLNTIQAIGKDQVGNSATASITVTREAITAPFIKLLSGNSQSGPVGAALAQPLVVQLLNGQKPVPKVPVIFKITENDGYLSLTNGKKLQLIAVNTNAEGKAEATPTLGNRAGAGNNIVEVYATGYQGTALFTASGTPTAVANINVDAGTNQFGPVGNTLPLPFVAVVTDSGHNRLGGVPVTFKVTQGGGNINGKASFDTVSDSDGRVQAVLTLGPAAGQDNNVVEADFSGNTGFAAAFTASGKVPGDPSKTSISGVVLDNSNNPISNVTMRVFKPYQGTNNNQQVQVGNPVLTDDKGAFKIAPAPVGIFKLMADGTTGIQGGKQFPTLEYDLLTVAGQDNTVGMPIYLPTLDPDAKVCVDATTGGVLKMASSPGFSLTLLPGAATFPGGSKTGCVTVTPVNPDKVPMVPGFGQQPRYVVTIQPVGTTFSPPAAITIPNMDGLAPNAKTEMYSYDHDLAAFVAIGSGTVSADGSVIASDPGIGVLKAGWHCGGNPNSTGSAGSCPECNKCQGSSCILDDSKVPKDTTLENCKKPACDKGVLKEVPDDSDKPKDKCKFCKPSTGNVIDVSQATDPGGLNSLTYLPLKMDKIPNGWGVTSFDDPVIDITAYCAGNDWKARITTADSQIHQGVRLLPGVIEVTPNLISSTESCAVLDTMTKSLNDVADQNSDSGYYMISAVKAHEDLHVTQYQTYIAPGFNKLKGSLEGLSIPLKDADDPATAKAKIKALAGYVTANTIFHTDDVAANDKTAAHNPKQPFIDVEHSVVDSRILTIAGRKSKLKCPP